MNTQPITITTFGVPPDGYDDTEATDNAIDPDDTMENPMPTSESTTMPDMQTSGPPQPSASPLGPQCESHSVKPPHQPDQPGLPDRSHQPDQSYSQQLHEMEKTLCGDALSAKQLGALGERYAACWLEQHGWRTLERNWRCRFGELDIIMLTPDKTLVFVEVKTRRTLRYGTPQSAIDEGKQANLRHAATLWLAGPGRRVNHLGIRFDAMSIWVYQGHALTHHIPEAF